MSRDKITSIIAHIDHGKTTLIDSLIASTGFFSKSLAGELRYLDSRKDEQARGITLKLSPIKLKNGHVFIDTPGHVDFESLIFSSSALGENHLILIDVNEGITPRTYSLVKFLNRSRCILVLNKVDKCIDFDLISMIIVQINGLLKEEVFEWSKNNIILCSSSLGAGISYRTFKQSKKNSISMAFKAFKLLDEKIEKKDTAQIIEKFNIKFPNRKSIFNVVLPLFEAIFDTVNYIYEKEDPSNSTSQGLIAIPEVSNDSICNSPTNLAISNDEISSEEELFKYEIADNSFYSIHCNKMPDIVAITTYSILKNRSDYSKENILFLVRILRGTVKKGQTLYCCNLETTKEVVVEEICDFEIEKYIEIDSFNKEGLVLLKGDFLKNSALCSEPVDFKLKNFPTGFYTSKLVLKDLSQINNMKEMIKVLGVVEQNLKCRLNKFSEFEFRCNGSVQFEKICFDLKENGFDFVIKTAKKEFKEQSTCETASSFIDNNRTIDIGAVAKFDDFIKSKKFVGDIAFNQENCIQDDEKNNIYYVESENNRHIIESVLDVFTDYGPLIKENITNTFFVIQSVSDNDNRFFSVLKNELTSLYLSSNPTVYPMFINLRIFVTQKFSGVVYLCLQKFFYLVDNEDYDDDTGFIVLVCKVPQFNFNDLVDEIRDKSKGSAYLEVLGSEYIPINDFCHMIPILREEKGLYNDDLILEIVANNKL